MQIAPALHLINAGLVNVYLSLEPVPTLIDTGMPGQAQRILNYMQEQGIAPHQLCHIVLTHHDVDHIGSAAELRRRTGAKIYAHFLDAGAIAGREPRRPALKRFSHVLLRGPAFAVDVLLQGGEVVGGWQVLHTPGHSAGSISLYKPPVLIVGDLLRARDGCHENWPFMMEDPRAARESMRKLAQLDFDLLLAGHSGPLFNAAAQLRALVSSW